MERQVVKNTLKHFDFDSIVEQGEGGGERGTGTWALPSRSNPNVFFPLFSTSGFTFFILLFVNLRATPAAVNPHRRNLGGCNRLVGGLGRGPWKPPKN